MGAATRYALDDFDAVGIAHVAFFDSGATGSFLGFGIFGSFGFGLPALAAWFAGWVSVGVPGADSALLGGLLACEAGG